MNPLLWTETKKDYRWTRSDGAVVKWDAVGLHFCWLAYEPDPSERYLRMERGRWRKAQDGRLWKPGFPRRWKTAEAAMKAVDREYPIKEMQLDPDFRRDPKTDKYCVRCQKDIADAANAIKVTVNWSTWMVRRGGEELIGKDCAKRIGL